MTSLQKYRTIAFDIDIMRAHIRLSPISGQIDAGTWFAGMVPACYRPAVGQIVEREFRRCYGQPATIDNLEYLIDEIHSAIWAEVEPVLPSLHSIPKES
jgi:hypothetical protein